MRPAGFTLAALLLGVAAAVGQPPVPGAPVAGAPVAPVAAPADPKLDAHLAAWEKNMGDLTNFAVKLNLTRTVAPLGDERKYSGQVLMMKPNFAILRLNNDSDKTGADYEAFICNGKAVYEYNGLAKTITEWKLPDPKVNPAAATDNLMLDFLSGMKAKDSKDRFTLALFKEDKNYVYLDVKPVLGKDKAEFQQLRMALYGPGTKWPYLPAQVYMVKPNGDSELWKFTEPQTNLPNINAGVFQPQKVPGFEFREGKPPAPPPMGRPGEPKLPAGGGLPAGPGAVRPGVPPKK
jgi:TIGR03009 family protein